MWARIVLSILLVTALTEGTSIGGRETLSFDGLENNPRHFKATLSLPEGHKGLAPVVVLVHGSAGVDDRYAFHRPALHAAGIGTLEVDFKTNVFSNLSDRPPMATFQPWAFGALEALRSHPRVDAKRIAIMGFSLGGHLSVSVASRKVVTQWLGPGKTGFAAHVGFYPVCRWLKKNFDSSGPTGAPILILTGEKDSWGDGESCPEFTEWLNAQHIGVVSLTVYPNVHHGFDRKGSWSGYAPNAINKTAVLRWDAEAANNGRERAVNFLRRVFDL